VQSNVVWQDTKNFSEQISMKSGCFYVIKMNLVQIVLSTNTPKYRWKLVYRLIISVDRCIGRSRLVYILWDHHLFILFSVRA